MSHDMDTWHIINYSDKFVQVLSFLKKMKVFKIFLTGYTVDEEDPDYHVYSVNGQRCKRWKTTAKSTQDYIEEIMNSAKS